jgi:hypothetical protein
MDSPLMLPTMRASELMKFAESFAKDLANQLASINGQYLRDPAAKQYIETAFTGQMPSRPPDDYLPLFHNVFIAHMASYWSIVPDQG